MTPELLPLASTEGVATLDFSLDVPPDRYEALLITTRDTAFSDPGVRRIEVLVAASDRLRRRALHRAGFRLDGILRARLDDGSDVCHYALLRSDITTGRHGFTAVMNTVTARKRVIAHLLLTDAQGRVCSLETTFKPDHELPGGIVEPGESPRAGVIRESLEELSYRPQVGRLLVADWLAPHLGWEDAVELIFDGGVIDDPGVLRPDGGEIRAVHWLEPPEALRRMASFAEGRLRAALEARSTAGCIYLEAGQPIA